MLECRDLDIHLRGRAILQAVSVAVAPGEVVAVIGPNGAGKSTLLRALSGELAPSGGAVLIDGEAMAGLAPAHLSARRAVLPQSVELAFPFTVAEVVRLGLVGGAARQAGLVRRALEAVDLLPLADRPATAISGGEQQRAHLARVLAQLWSAALPGRPGYLLLDEPTASLDLKHQLDILRIARSHAAEGGGVLAILHDLNLAVLAADRLVALRNGRVVAAGPPADVLTDSLVRELYEVPVRVGHAPAAPFVLPHSAWA